MLRRIIKNLYTILTNVQTTFNKYSAGISVFTAPFYWPSTPFNDGAEARKKPMELSKNRKKSS